MLRLMVKKKIQNKIKLNYHPQTKIFKDIIQYLSIRKTLKILLQLKANKE